MRTLIVGYGNPLRTDDALGWRAVERLRGILAPGEAEVVALHQLTPELMETLSRADRAIFIDAAADGPPGRLSVHTVQARAGESSFTHHYTPESLLAGALALYGSAPRSLLFSVTGADFSLGERLSEPVAARLEELVAGVLAELASDAPGAA